MKSSFIFLSHVVIQLVVKKLLHAFKTSVISCVKYITNPAGYKLCTVARNFTWPPKRRRAAAKMGVQAMSHPSHVLLGQTPGALANIIS